MGESAFPKFLTAATFRNRPLQNHFQRVRLGEGFQTTPNNPYIGPQTQEL